MATVYAKMFQMYAHLQRHVWHSVSVSSTNGVVLSWSLHISQADGDPEVGNLQDKQYHRIVMQMKYIQYGQGKNATVKTWGNEPKWENSRWPPLTQ